VVPRFSSFENQTILHDGFQHADESVCDFVHSPGNVFREG